MKSVTTGTGISGVFADELELLIYDLGSQSKDQRWRLYITAQGLDYSLRVYAPDGHSAPHTIRKTISVMKEIRKILMNEAESWKFRRRAAETLRAGEPAAGPIN